MHVHACVCVCVCVCVCTYVYVLYAFMLCKSCTLWSVGHKLTVGYSCVLSCVAMCMNSAFSVHVLYRKHSVVRYNNRCDRECCVYHGDCVISSLLIRKQLQSKITIQIRINHASSFINIEKKHCIGRACIALSNVMKTMSLP